MAIALVAKTSAASSDTTSITTSGINTTGATLLTLFISNYELTTANTITDLVGGNSNTYVPLTVQMNTGQNRGRWYYVNSNTPHVGSGHTFSAVDGGGGASYPAIFVYTFSGTHATPLDSENGTNAGGSNTSTQFNGGVSPGQAGSVILAGWAWYNGGETGISINSSFSTPDTIVTASTNIPGGASYLIQGGAASVDPTVLWTGVDAVAACIVAFKPVAGAVTSHAIRTGVLGLEHGLSRKILK